MFSVDMLDKEINHIPGGRFHHTTGNDAQFKIYELFTSEIFI